MPYNPYNDNSTVYGDENGGQRSQQPQQPQQPHQPMRPIQQGGGRQPMRPMRQNGTHQGGYDAASTVYGGENGYSQPGQNVSVDVDAPASFDNSETMYGGDPNYASQQQPEQQQWQQQQWQQQQWQQQQWQQQSQQQQWPQQPQQQWQQSGGQQYAQQPQQQYGASAGYNSYRQQPKKKSNTGLIVLLFVIGLIVAGIVAVVLVNGKNDKETASSHLESELEEQAALPNGSISRSRLAHGEYTDGYIVFKVPDGFTVDDEGNPNEAFTFEKGDGCQLVICGEEVSSSYSESDFKEEVETYCEMVANELDVPKSGIKLLASSNKTDGDVKRYTQKLVFTKNGVSVNAEIVAMKSFKTNVVGKVLAQYTTGNRPDVDYIVNSIKFSN